MRNALLGLALLATPAVAQVPDWEREALPLRFGTVSDKVREELRKAWPQILRQGVETKWCVTAWEYGVTKDADTVGVALAIELQDTPKATRTSTGDHPPCRGDKGQPLPTLHAHLTGDCSYSRGDATNAIKRGAPFDLILCGPGITAGYVWTNMRQVEK